MCAITGVDTCCTTYFFKVISNDCSPAVASMQVVNNSSETKPNKNIRSTNTAGLQGEINLNILPNPSYNGQVQVEFQTTETESFQYDITGTTGQKMSSGRINSNTTSTIQTSTLVPGIYIMSIYLSDKKITKRMVIGQK